MCANLCDAASAILKISAIEYFEWNENMKLTDHESAMLAGEEGPARKYAMEQVVNVGQFFDAEDCVEIAQVHLMADPESLGDECVSFLEGLAELPEEERLVRAPTITDPRGVDLNHYRPLGQTEEMATIERPVHRRVSRPWRDDDRHLHQLSNHHAAIARRSCCLWRHWRCDLFKQRLWRTV